ncbi:MAG: hypothetical protein EOO77_34495 [Oxalobacteraceae bacterium]|nr:MAG: hypothetical protein EOO77_34495 [Oxalobacteraceae bacterium]
MVNEYGAGSGAGLGKRRGVSVLLTPALAQPLLQARSVAHRLDTSPTTRSNTMTVQALLSLPVVQTLSPVEVFALLKRTAAAEQLKQRITSCTGSPMLGCFADLMEFDVQLDASAITHTD